MVVSGSPNRWQVACNPPTRSIYHLYTTYIPLIYCHLGDYMLPTTFWGNQKQPLIAPKFSFVFFCGGWDKKCVFRNQRLTDPSGSHCQIWSMSRAGRRFPKKMEDHGFGRKIGKNAANNLAHLRLALFP